MELQSLLTGIFSPFYLSIVCQVCYVCIIIIIIVTTRIILLLLFHTIITIISLSTFSLSLVRSIMVIITIAIIMIMQLLALRIFFFKETATKLIDMKEGYQRGPGAPNGRVNNIIKAVALEGDLPEPLSFSFLSYCHHQLLSFYHHFLLNLFLS